MKPKHLLSLSVLLISAACSQPEQKPLTQYVDMYIGTGGHGHVFMGANVPFGAVQLGPTSIPQSWDWVSGYHISDTTVIGFSHTHLNGTGIGDLFDVTVMPVVGGVTYARGTEDDPQSGLWSYFRTINGNSTELLSNLKTLNVISKTRAENFLNTICLLQNSNHKQADWARAHN